MQLVVETKTKQNKRGVALSKHFDNYMKASLYSVIFYFFVFIGYEALWSWDPIRLTDISYL